MADPFVAEIRIFPFNFPPKGWAFCDGQLMPISQNTALFSLLGTVYGGDGKSTFALPDLQGRSPMHPGQGQGLSLRDQGEIGGTETVTLLISEIPFHTHQMVTAANEAAESSTVTNNSLTRASLNIYTPAAGFVQMAPETLAPAGGSLPHNNLQPYLTLNYCIAMQGVFPQRP
jgi:microcystin-dependent protein